MTVLSGRTAAACLMAGSALWLSTSVFDRVGTGGGTRVALLSSWQELAGLIILTLLLVLFGQALVERALQRGGADRALSPDLLLPAVGLGVLALPYLPWVADLVPALDALAGPGRWLVLTVIVGQVVWTAVITVGRAGETSIPSPRASRAAMWQLGAVWVTSVAIFAACAFRLAPGPIYPGGDEPHYLIVTQSLLTDHDLAIANNYARGDYLQYFPAPLKRDYRVAGREGVIYSIHPVGLSVLIAPAFALGGYRAASLVLAALAALAVTLAWRWGFQATGSPVAATVGWLAVATSAPFVLHSFSIYPECAAALAVIVAFGPAFGARDGTATDALMRGVALGALPWLSTKYAPLSAVALLVLAGRARGRWVALGAPYVASLTLWFGYFWWLYGIALPTAPYGTAYQMSLANLKAGLAGLFADQEYGALASAPALALAAVGLWRLWRRDAEGSRLARMILAPLATLAVTTGAFALWWGGSAPPGRELVAALPLLAPPLAWLWHDSFGRPVHRASLEWLVLVGITLTATMVLARGGLLIANGRDGISALLEYLDPARNLVRAVPSFVAFRDAVAVPLVATMVWIGLAALAWIGAGRWRAHGAGAASLAASALGVAAMTLAAAIVPALFGPRLPAPIPVEARVQAAALDSFDQRARSIGIVYSPFHIVAPVEVASLVRFVAMPGQRMAPQPIRVLFNARLGLPAGRYRVALTPVNGQMLSGELGLQVGRLGPPAITWQVAGASDGWSTEFALDLDAAFVGFQATPELEARIGRLEVAPLTVVDRGERMMRPPVLATARYGDVMMYFHDDRAYVEPTGFWARGHSTIALTVATPETSGPRTLALRLHGGGPDPVAVAFAAPSWSTRVVLAPDVTSDLVVPVATGQRLLPLTIVTESGFVPAEHGGASNDYRVLGCWVEVPATTGH